MKKLYRWFYGTEPPTSASGLSSPDGKTREPLDTINNPEEAGFKTTSGTTSTLYKPLPQPSSTRIVSFIGKHNSQVSTIDCQLEVIDLDESRKSADRIKPEYNAISYVWGDQKIKKDIVCNGQTVCISENLHAALLRIWSSHPTWKIWADALSISQTDIREKGQQVNLMGRIFQSASRVIIWLGNEGEFTHFAWEEIPNTISSTAGAGNKRISTETESMTHTLWERGLSKNDAFLRVNINSDNFQVNTYSGDIPANQFVRGLLDICFRSWFFRAWTFQEIILARTPIVMCGRLEADWSAFSNFVWWAQLKFSPGEWLWLVSERDEVVSLQKFGYQRDTLLSAFLLCTRTRQAQDPRDKVYSLLGPLREGRYAQLTADYSLSVREVYIRAARTCIETEENVNMMVAAGLVNVSRESWPSWVPDWETLSSSIDKDITSLNNTANQDLGLRFWKLLSGPRSRGSEIELRGVALGRLKSTERSDVFALEAFPNCVMDPLKAHRSSKHPRPPSQQSIFKNLRKHHSGIHVCEPPYLGCQGDGGLVTRGWNRGLPEISQDGDWLCVFFGGSHVFVVRPDRVNDTFTLVGGAFTHYYLGYDFRPNPFDGYKMENRFGDPFCKGSPFEPFETNALVIDFVLR